MIGRSFAVFSIGLTLCLRTFAAGSSEFDKSLVDALAKSKTKPGTDYTARYSNVLGGYVGSALDACGPNYPDMNKPAYLVLTIAADGHLTKKLAEPDSPFGQCIASHLPSGMLLPHPPEDGWLIVVGVQNQFHRQSESAGAPASKATLNAYNEAVAPYMAKGRATYPAAKARFLKGLPNGNRFIVRTRLTQKPNKVEEVFIVVTAIEGNNVHGVLDRVDILTNYHTGQRIAVPESEIEDWLIQHPDGTQEGNVVGKFLNQHKL